MRKRAAAALMAWMVMQATPAAAQDWLRSYGGSGRDSLPGNRVRRRWNPCRGKHDVFGRRFEHPHTGRQDRLAASAGRGRKRSLEFLLVARWQGGDLQPLRA